MIGCLFPVLIIFDKFSGRMFFINFIEKNFHILFFIFANEKDVINSSMYPRYRSPLSLMKR